MASIDEEMETSFANNKNRLLSNLVYTGNWIKNRFGDYLKPFGVSIQQFHILRILRGADDWLTMNEIRNRMVEKSPNATRLCDKLIEKQLIERNRSREDRRVVRLRISKLGLKLLSDFDEKNDGSYKSYINNITDEEAKIASDIIDKLRS